MSDDVRIPVHAPFGPGRVSSAYRARRGGGETRSRAVLIAGLAFAGVVVVGVAGWAVMGRAPGAVPIIEADSRPLRVKPDNPGGMQVAGADELVMGEQAGGGERMAPASEAPAPQALRAQMQQAAAPAEPAALPGVAAPGVALPGVALPGVTSSAGLSPLPDTPGRAAPAARTAAAPAAPVAVPATAAASAAPSNPVSARAGISVQLAAVDTEAAATAEWRRLAKRMPEVLGDRRPVIQKAERDGHAIWRVRTGGFADMAEATGFCTRLRAKGGACTLASF